MVLRLRAFKAIEDPESCAKFVKGHGDILTSIGVNKVTSSSPNWVENPGTFVLVVEDPDTNAVLGGARVDTSFGNGRLPISDATAYMDPKVDEYIAKEAKTGTGEICGLWNSRKVAGMGFGSLFLTRAAVTISHAVGVKSLFALCAPYTVATAETFGYGIIKELGNDGTFYYPKLDLLATAMLLPDTFSIVGAAALEKERIISLRENSQQYFEEDSRRRKVPIQYDLGIKV